MKTKCLHLQGMDFSVDLDSSRTNLHTIIIISLEKKKKRHLWDREWERSTEWRVWSFVVLFVFPLYNFLAGKDNAVVSRPFPRINR